MLLSKHLLKSLEMMMGGRAAEDVIYKNFSTGASNDLERASQLAYQMVCNWGMSQDVGPVIPIVDWATMSKFTSLANLILLV